MATDQVRISTTVQAGGRICFFAPDLAQGERVDVVVVRRPTDSISGDGSDPEPHAAMDYILSLPPRKRTAEEWALIEREFQEDRDAWDR